jgi:hypothetical protein
MAKRTPSPADLQGIVLSMLQFGSMNAKDIFSRLDKHYTFEQINANLEKLEELGKIRSVIVLGEGVRIELSDKPLFFSFRHITPLVYGMPEWIVEAVQPEGNRLVCWCTREFDAQLITSALNGKAPS